MAEDIRAVAKNVPISAQKSRLVVDMVRGKNVVEALDTLKFVGNKSRQTGIQSSLFCHDQCRRELWHQPQ